MDYMKGYINRNRRRRASRHRTKKGRRRSRRSSNSTGYYMGKSKYSSLNGQKISAKYIAVAAGLVAALVLVITGIFVFQSFKGDDEQGQLARGNGTEATVSPNATVMASPNAAVTASPDAAVTTSPDAAVTNPPDVQASAVVTAAPTPKDVTGAETTGTQTANAESKGDEKTEPQETMDPNGIAAVIAALPTINPQVVPTPQPKPRSKAVALTFDDGPSTVNTPKVLELLKKYNAHATFFILGTRASAGAEVLKQEVAQGCEIGNHSWDHTNLAGLSMKKVNKQYNKTANLVKRLVGYDITLLRPPYGAISQKMRNKLKHPMVLWNVDTLDWKYKNTKKIMKQLKKNVKDGDIILMHDIHPTTAEALKKVLPWLVKNDYDILTVSELAARKGAKLTNGKAYGGFSG